VPLIDIFPGVPHVESPLFPAMVDELGLSAEEIRIGTELHQRGYAVMNFPDPELDERVERIKRTLAPRFDLDLDDPASVKNVGHALRVQDAWTYDEDVRAVAANQAVLDLLTKLYGRRAFPFQTLNFPVGTQQPLHSDSVHFSSVPERFMCGVWLAMEDISRDAGPLTYLPGSHRWPVLKNSDIGRTGWRSELSSAQEPFQLAWEALISHSNQASDTFLPRKGQALIWAANLLHGGSPQKNPHLTRWSQVTHYYFERCIYYTPAFSDEPLGRLDLRTVTNVATGEIEPNVYGNELVQPAEQVADKRRRLLPRLFRKKPRVPEGFDGERYKQLNPDVAATGLDPADHYIRFGRQERRRYT